MDFPAFASIYQEIADFVKNPEELIGMLSEELYIMDKNMERLMVSELKEEAEQAKSELEMAKAELQEARAEKAKAAAELNDIVAERNNIVAERDNVIAERDNVIAERNNVIAERNNVIAERDKTTAERNIFKLKCQGKTPEMISGELHLSIEYVNSVLAELEIS